MSSRKRTEQVVFAATEGNPPYPASASLPSQALGRHWGGSSPQLPWRPRGGKPEAKAAQAVRTNTGHSKEAAQAGAHLPRKLSPHTSC